MEDRQSYQDEFDHDLSRVRSFLSSYVRSQTTLRECDRLLSSAQRCAIALHQIAEESGDTFQIAQSKKRMEQDIAPLLEEVERAKKNNQSSKLHSERNELFIGYRAPTGIHDDVEQLIRNSEELLKDSQRMCMESEMIGDETLGLMGRQGDQLRSAQGYLSATNASVSQARIMLQNMSRKAMRNKRFLKSIILMLILANITVLVVILRKKAKK